MANASIGGLISGLDTATIITQLMQLESRPQAMLQSRVTSQQKALTSLQTVNAKLANIASKAADLAKLSAWSPTKATSTDDKVTVTATTSAAPASLAFDVVATATSTRATFGTALPTSATAAGTPTFSIDHTDPGRADVVLTLTDTSLKGVAAAINDPANKTGLTATLVRAGGTDAAPTYTLNVASTATGTASGFTIDDGTGAFLGGASTTAGVNAEILVNGTTLTSSSNTFTDLMPGVSVTLAAGASGGATIDVTRDTAGLATSVGALVDAVNAALDDIEGLTAYKSDSKAAGILAGDATLRTIRDQLLATVTRGVDGQSLASVGIQVDRSGNLVLDRAKLTTAYDSDPAGTAAKFAGTATWTGSGTVTLKEASWRTGTPPGGFAVDATGPGATIDGVTATVSGGLITGTAGTTAEGLTVSFTAGAAGTLAYKQGFAAALEALAQRVSNATDGVLTATIKGRTTQVDRMEDDIAAWDVRLAQRRAGLQRQYGALEVALGKLQSQSSWLAGQISSLPSLGQ